MSINELLKQQNMTKYRLSKKSGVPHTTINDICNNRVKIEKCAGDTLYKLSKALGVSMEALIEDAIEYRGSFESFKSNVCHMVKDMGDMGFIADTTETDRVRRRFDKKWYPESLYMLAMIDYLSRENGLPLNTDYNDLRAAKLQSPIYPASIVAICAAMGSDRPKKESLKNAIPEFKKFNIVDNGVRNVN
jgi:transcriptional regulator with XRE-family HTH domain